MANGLLLQGPSHVDQAETVEDTGGSSDSENKILGGEVETEGTHTAAMSPFLPGTQIQFAWDSTSLNYFKTCPRLYQYTVLEGWHSREESVHLRFGIEYHKALQDYDVSRAAGISHEDSLFDVVRALLLRTDDWRPDDKYKNRENLVRTVIWYIDRFHPDPAETFIKEDGKPAVEVSFRFELDWGPVTSQIKEAEATGMPGQPYLLCGHLDRVVRYQDELFVMDRKTTKSTPGPYFFDGFEPNNQMTLYTIAGQIIFNAPIKGVIIDAAQVAIEFSRFTRGLTYRTKDQLGEWLHDLRYWLQKAEEHAVAGYWPMNDLSCDKFGGCRFRKICSKSPGVREQFLKSNFEKGKPWNPLETR